MFELRTPVSLEQNQTRPAEPISKEYETLALTAA